MSFTTKFTVFTRFFGSFYSRLGKLSKIDENYMSKIPARKSFWYLEMSDINFGQILNVPSKILIFTLILLTSKIFNQY